MTPAEFTPQDVTLSGGMLHSAFHVGLLAVREFGMWEALQNVAVELPSNGVIAEVIFQKKLLFYYHLLTTDLALIFLWFFIKIKEKKMFLMGILVLLKGTLVIV